ncbi:UbiD family decarboxylase domain-containing protein, partial [Paracoccus sp. (in: a-proteobacteria)]|uniref:UbiD family decarboxylase domain-containing protein n=1 Tax=Paracoccus sp. TaxID=267 RepID=UPI0035B4AB70
MRSLPVFADLRAYLDWCAAQGDLARIDQPVSLRHEMTAVQLACLRRAGPVLEFPRHDGPQMRVVSNLFGTPDRVAAGLGLTPDKVAEFGEFLAALRSPAPVAGMRDALTRWPMLRAALATRPKILRSGPVQERELSGLDQIPVQTPWPGDAGPLITWPVVITRPHGTEPAAL